MVGWLFPRHWVVLSTVDMTFGVLSYYRLPPYYSIGEGYRDIQDAHDMADHWNNLAACEWQRKAVTE